MNRVQSKNTKKRRRNSRIFFLLPSFALALLTYTTALILVFDSIQPVQCARQRSGNGGGPSSSPTKQFNSNDYYVVLGLNKKATTKDVKKAYRKLALQYHPDKAKGDEKAKEKSEKIFIKVSEAYAVLGDEKTKGIYDKYGKRGLELHEKGIDPETAGFGSGNDSGSSGNGNGRSRSRSYSGGFPGGGQRGNPFDGGFGFDFGGGGNTGPDNFNFNDNKRRTRTDHDYQYSGHGADFDPRKMFEEMFGSDADFKGNGHDPFGDFAQSAHFNFDGFTRQASGGFGGGTGFGAGDAFEQMFGARDTKKSVKRTNKRRQEYAPDLYSEKDPSGIVQLDKAKFPTRKSKHIWVVIFYQNDSRETASLKPAFASFAKKVKGTFKVGAVNCDQSSKEKRLCQTETQSKKLPAFGVVVNGKVSMFTRDNNKAPSMKKLYEFAVEQIPSNLVKLVNEPSHIQSYLHNAVRKKVRSIGSILLITDKSETSAKYASLAYGFREEFIFAETRGETLSVEKHLKVKVNKYPLLVAFVLHNGSKITFDMVTLEDPNKQDIGEWIESLVSKYGKKKRSQQSR